MALDFAWLADPFYQTWLLRGVGITILISVLGNVLMLVIGVAGLACLHFRVPVLDTVTTILVELFRNTPPLVQLFFLYFTLSELGLLLADPVSGRQIPLFSGLTCVVLSLGLYNGAIAVEILRSGLLAVPRQTVEGARSLGYSRWQIFRQVELPIGFRLSVPTMTSNVVSLIKTSAQASLVAVGDTMYYANQIMLETFRNLEVMIVVLAIYIAIAGSTAIAARQVARAVRIPGFGS